MEGFVRFIGTGGARVVVGIYRLKDVDFSVPARHVHPVEAYAVVLRLNRKIAPIADTRFFEHLPARYQAV